MFSVMLEILVIALIKLQSFQRYHKFYCVFIVAKLKNGMFGGVVNSAKRRERECWCSLQRPRQYFQCCHFPATMMARTVSGTLFSFIYSNFSFTLFFTNWLLNVLITDQYRTAKLCPFVATVITWLQPYSFDGLCNQSYRSHSAIRRQGYDF